MQEREYPYDVAFSFLAEDEELVSEVNDLLEGRLKTFLYSKAQEQVAGTDGELTFNQVFQSEARTVVIFHRSNWGQTPWTRIEETAIRNRAYEKGYDFSLFIPLDKPPRLPVWVPKSRIWIDLDRWGIRGAAAVIESRAHEAGAAHSQESAIDLARRLGREKERERERDHLLQSPDGLSLAEAEVQSLFRELDRIVHEINQATAPAPDAEGLVRLGDEIIVRERDDRRRRFALLSMTLTVAWSRGVSPKTSGLAVQIALGSPWQGKLFGEVVQDWRFHFDIAPTGGYDWREMSSGERYLSPRLADELMKELQQWAKKSAAENTTVTTHLLNELRKKPE